MGCGQRTTPLGLALALALGCGPSSRPPADTVTVATEDPAVGEEEQFAAIAEAMNEFSKAVHSCWAMAAADDFRLEGQVLLSLTVGPERQSTDVEVVSDTARDPKLASCLQELWSDYRWPEVFAVGQGIRLPPFEFVAPEAQYTVAESHVEARSLAEGKLSVKVLLDEHNSGNGAAAMSLLTLREGMTVPLHRHDSAELLFVLSGTGRLEGLGGAPREVGPGSAIYVPRNVAHGFVHTGTEPIELVQLYAPGGAEQRFKNPALTAGTTPVSPDERSRNKAPQPLLRQVADASAFALPGGKSQVRILFDAESAGDGAAYLGALIAEPGAVVPPHRHSESTELLLILEGEARMTIGGQEMRVQPGDAVQIPPGLEHSAEIVGGEALKTLQFYSPSGPEQRFKGQPAQEAR